MNVHDNVARRSLKQRGGKKREKEKKKEGINGYYAHKSLQKRRHKKRNLFLQKFFTVKLLFSILTIILHFL